jgi:hypothetical protein
MFAAAKLPVTVCKSLQTIGKLDITTPHDILILKFRKFDLQNQACAYFRDASRKSSSVFAQVTTTGIFPNVKIKAVVFGSRMRMMTGL